MKVGVAFVKIIHLHARQIADPIQQYPIDLRAMREGMREQKQDLRRAWMCHTMIVVDLERPFKQSHSPRLAENTLPPMCDSRLYALTYHNTPIPSKHRARNDGSHSTIRKPVAPQGMTEPDEERTQASATASAPGANGFRTGNAGWNRSRRASPAERTRTATGNGRFRPANGPAPMSPQTLGIYFLKACCATGTPRDTENYRLSGTRFR